MSRQHHSDFSKFLSFSVEPQCYKTLRKSLSIILRSNVRYNKMKLVELDRGRRKSNRSSRFHHYQEERRICDFLLISENETKLQVNKGNETLGPHSQTKKKAKQENDVCILYLLSCHLQTRILPFDFRFVPIEIERSHLLDLFFLNNSILICSRKVYSYGRRVCELVQIIVLQDRKILVMLAISQTSIGK